MYTLRKKGGLNIAGQKNTERDKKKWDREGWNKKKLDETEYDRTG
jgi:hypothetical protein